MLTAVLLALRLGSLAFIKMHFNGWGSTPRFGIKDNYIRHTEHLIEDKDGEVVSISHFLRNVAPFKFKTENVVAITPWCIDMT